MNKKSLINNINPSSVSLIVSQISIFKAQFSEASEGSVACSVKQLSIHLLINYNSIITHL